MQLMPRKKGADSDLDSLRKAGGEFASRLPFASQADRRDSVEPVRPQATDLKIMPPVTRPTYLELPRPPHFNPDGSLRDESPQTSLSSTLNNPKTPAIEIEAGLQVLVVDDDRMTRMLMERMLTRLQCVVTTAVNGQQALKLLLGASYVDQPPPDEDAGLTEEEMDDGPSVPQAHASQVQVMEESKFAIVFLDNQMPVMSGVEMVRRLRKMERRDLVVGVTGAFFCGCRVFGARF